MAWRVLTLQHAERAIKDLDDLERVDARRVRAGIIRYAETGSGNVKRLQGERGYRLRVGDYRVRFEVIDGQIAINVRDPRGPPARGLPIAAGSRATP